MSHSRLAGDRTAKSERRWPMSVVGSSRVNRNAISGRRALAQILRHRDSRVGCRRLRDRIESPMWPPLLICTYTCLISIVRTLIPLSSPCDHQSRCCQRRWPSAQGLCVLIMSLVSATRRGRTEVILRSRTTKHLSDAGRFMRLRAREIPHSVRNDKNEASDREIA